MSRWIPVILILGLLPQAAIGDEDALIWRSEDCAEVRLQVQHADTGKPIRGAWIHAPLPGADMDSKTPLTPAGRTDETGAFVFTDKRPAWVRVTRQGMSPLTVELPCSETPTAVAAVMHPVPPQWTETASAGGDVHRRMDGKLLEAMPGTPRNMFQALQTLPGVVRPTLTDTLLSSVLGYGDIAIRGARPGETKVYLDGIEVPYFYHYLGLSSVLPAEMLEFADLIPGGAGPEFGRHTGGVIEARSAASYREADDTWHGHAGITLFEGNGIVRGPVAGGTLSVSDRFSLWDLVAMANGGSFGQGIPVWGYNDFQVVYKKPIGSKHELQALVLGAWDDVSFSDRPTQVRTEFYRAGVSWRTRMGESSYRLAASYGYDSARIRIQEASEGLDLDTTRNDHDVRLEADAEWKVHPRVPAIRSGVEVHGVRPEMSAALDWEIQEYLIVDRTYYDYGIWAAGWTEAEIRPVPTVVLLPGLRYDYDTLVGRGWLDPRLTARWFIDKRTSVSLSGGIYHRPQPFTLAFVEQEHLGTTESHQVSAGVTWDAPPFSGGRAVVDVRGFYNEFRDQIHGTEWLPQFEQSILGDGEAFGSEVYLTFEFPTDNIEGALGYTLSRTQWRNDGTDGMTTPSNLDTTHGATLVLQYGLPRGWSIGGRMRYFTGFPYTTYDADVYIPDVGWYVGVGETPWAGRAPAFFQSDVRVSKRWQVGDRLALEWYFDLQNATFRQNVDRFTAGGRPTQPTASPTLPFLPSTGVGGSF